MIKVLLWILDIAVVFKALGYVALKITPWLSVV